MAFGPAISLGTRFSNRVSTGRRHSRYRRTGRFGVVTGASVIDVDEEDNTYLPRAVFGPNAIRRNRKKEVEVGVSYLPVYAASIGYTQAEIKRAFRVGIRKSARLIMRAYKLQGKGRAPVDTGRLRRGIKVKRKNKEFDMFTPGFYIWMYSQDTARRGGQEVFYFHIQDARNDFNMTRGSFEAIKKPSRIHAQDQVNRQLDLIRKETG